MYRTVQLHGEGPAVMFLKGLQRSLCAEHIASLYLGMLVTIPTITQILRLCGNLTELSLQSAIHFIAEASKNPLTEPMCSLWHLKKLHIGLASVPTSHYAFLPDFQLFRCITHLHLAGGVGTGLTIPDGISRLLNLTHLSLHWGTSLGCGHTLRAFLKRQSTVVLILWTSSILSVAEVESNLLGQGLAQLRVVLFKMVLVPEFMSAGGFWPYTERVVQWQVNNRGGAHSSSVGLQNLKNSTVEDLRCPPYLTCPLWFNWFFNGHK